MTFLKVLKRRKVNLKFYTHQKYCPKIKENEDIFRQTEDGRIYDQTYTTLNIKGSSSGWKKMITDGKPDLQKEQRTPEIVSMQANI